MKFLHILFILIAFHFQGLFAQNTTNQNNLDTTISIKRKTIYYEAYGQALTNSISIDKLYRIDKKVKTSFTSGIAFRPIVGLIVLGVPISYNVILGQKNHHLELGLGYTIMYLRDAVLMEQTLTDGLGNTSTITTLGHKNDFATYLTPKISYRYQQVRGGLFFRITFTPYMFGFLRKGNSHNSTYNIQDGENILLNLPFTSYFTTPSFMYPFWGFSIGYTKKDKIKVIIPDDEL